MTTCSIDLLFGPMDSGGDIFDKTGEIRALSWPYEAVQKKLSNYRLIRNYIYKILGLAYTSSVTRPMCGGGGGFSIFPHLGTSVYYPFKLF